ncbi:transmembrane 117-like, partial [Paramuricea clavata]
YPPGGWSVLKVFILLCGIAVGMSFGKFIVHKRLLRKRLRLQMFQGDQGSWMIMFLTTIISLFIFSHIFNGFLSLGSDLDRYKLSGFFGVSNANFMKFAALGTWTGDFVTAWMVTDIMLQEKLYPSWAVYLRSIWRRKWHRIIAFWAVWILATIIVATGITTDFVKWDDLNRDFVSTNELSRAFLASIILVMDLLIVMQDWDFPHFQSAIDIKLPGVNTSSFYFTPPRCLRKENWAVHVTGKWFNYGVIFIVMILDINMWKNQIFYDPFTFGQYTDSDGYIYTVSNTTFVENANKTTLSHEWRWNHTNPMTNRTYGEDDLRMNSKYLGYSLGVKGLAFVPSIVAFIVFGLLVWFYGRVDAAVNIVSAPSQVDGIVVDQWEYEEKPSHQGGKHDQEMGITSESNSNGKPRPKSGPISVEEVDSKSQPVLTSYEMKTLT